MAANQKAVFATGWTTHGGKTFMPGQRIDEHMPAHAVQGALEGGVATDVPARAEQAKKDEMGRREQVAQMQASRSQKRGQAGQQ
jgi:hypothetical protein